MEHRAFKTRIFLIDENDNDLAVTYNVNDFNRFGLNEGQGYGIGSKLRYDGKLYEIINVIFSHNPDYDLTRLDHLPSEAEEISNVDIYNFQMTLKLKEI